MECIFTLLVDGIYYFATYRHLQIQAEHDLTSILWLGLYLYHVLYNLVKILLFISGSSKNLTYISKIVIFLNFEALMYKNAYGFFFNPYVSYVFFFNIFQICRFSLCFFQTSIVLKYI